MLTPGGVLIHIPAPATTTSSCGQPRNRQAEPGGAQLPQPHGHAPRGPRVSPALPADIAPGGLSGQEGLRAAGQEKQACFWGHSHTDGDAPKVSQLGSGQVACLFLVLSPALHVVFPAWASPIPPLLGEGVRTQISRGSPHWDSVSFPGSATLWLTEPSLPSSFSTPCLVAA